jgi:SOS-response transcriptional repressor LexA
MAFRSINNNMITVSAGLSVGQIGKAISNNAGINSTSIEKILHVYTEINPEWLLTGKGDMIKKKSEIIALEPTGSDNVILLDAKAAAYTFSNAYTEPITLDNYETLRVPKLQHRRGTFYAIEISGDSMHPTISNGDHLVCRQIAIDEFVSGMVYAMWHQEHGLICKRPSWIDREKGTILMQSDNERISSWTTHISELSAMLEAECKISFNLRSWNNGYRSELSELKERIIKLEKKIF